MHLRSSLVCLGLLAISVACSDKGSGGDEDTGGTSSTTGGKGTAGSSAGSNNVSGKGGGSSTAGTDSGEAGMPAAEGGSQGGGDEPTKVWTFDTTVEGFIVQDSSAAVDVDPVPKADVMISHNADDGEPDPGSVQMDIPYSAASQYVSMGVNLPQAVDLTGKTIKAWVMIQSGYGDAEDLMTAPGNAKLYVKTGADYIYASAAVANLTTAGVWVEITFDPELPGYTAEPMASYDPTKVMEIGIQLDTSSTSISAAPAVVLIDSISY